MFFPGPTNTCQQRPFIHLIKHFWNIILIVPIAKLSSHLIHFLLLPSIFHFSRSNNALLPIILIFSFITNWPLLLLLQSIFQFSYRYLFEELSLLFVFPPAFFEMYFNIHFWYRSFVNRTAMHSNNSGVQFVPHFPPRHAARRSSTKKSIFAILVTTNFPLIKSTLLYAQWFYHISKKLSTFK